MHIYLVAIGTTPTWAQRCIDQYLRRLAHWSVTIQSVPGYKLHKKDIQLIKRKETESLLRALPKKSYNILLDVTGTSMDSSAFAATLHNIGTPISFIIGGAYGVDIQHCPTDACWSLSPLTLTHEFTRLLLIEQIYRAHTITAQHPYHK